MSHHEERVKRPSAQHGARAPSRGRARRHQVPGTAAPCLWRQGTVTLSLGGLSRPSADASQGATRGAQGPRMSHRQLSEKRETLLLGALPFCVPTSNGCGRQGTRGPATPPPAKAEQRPV